VIFPDAGLLTHPMVRDATRQAMARARDRLMLGEPGWRPPRSRVTVARLLAAPAIPQIVAARTTDLTPAMAAYWIGRIDPLNDGLVDPALVDAMAALIDAGAWAGAYSPFVVSLGGRGLLDGKHRCHAVMRTGKAIPVLMVYAQAAAAA
jgi:hypothetical protein